MKPKEVIYSESQKEQLRQELLRCLSKNKVVPRPKVRDYHARDFVHLIRCPVLKLTHNELLICELLDKIQERIRRLELLQNNNQQKD